MCHCLRLRQNGSQVMVIAWFHTRDFPCIHILLVLQIDGVVNRAKRLIIEHFSTLHHQVLRTHLQVFITCLEFLHSHHGLTALLHGHEIYHG